MRQSARAALRLILVEMLFFLSPERRLALERRLRGREEHHRIRDADVVLVSWAKSGRTWLRLMLSRYYQRRHRLPEGSFLEYDNLHRLAPEIPTVFFTHGNYLRDYTGNWDSKCDFHGKRVLLLVRDPRDVAVSQYFQWAHRMHPRKKRLNRYPPDGDDISLYEFVAEHEAGLTRIIEFYNLWAAELAHLKEDALVIRYEDLRAEPHRELGRALLFLGATPTEQELDDAVEYAAFDNMRRLEESGEVRASGRRLVPGRRGEPDSYKVRRAKVGGYRDYFDDAQVAAIETRLARELTPAFGYVASASEPGETRS